MAKDNPRPTHEELEALPDSIKRYIAALEANLLAAERSVQDDADELRRKRFAYWKSR